MKQLLIFLIIYLVVRTINSWCLRTIFAGVTSIESVDFSSDGQYIVTGQTSGRVLLWKTDTLQILKTYTFPAKLWEAVFSKDQQIVVIAGQINDVYIIDAVTFAYLDKITTGHGKVYDVDVRYDSNRILTCGEDSKTRIWNISDINPGNSPPYTMPLMVTNPNNNKAYTCQYGDNNWYAVGGAKFLQTYDNTWNQVYSYVNTARQNYYGLRVGPGANTFIAVNQDGVIVQGTMNSGNTNTFPTGSAGGLYACGYTRDGTYFAVAGSNGYIYMYNATTSTLQSVLQTNSTSTIRSARFSYDSNYFLAGNQNGSVYFYYRFCTGCPVGSYMNGTTSSCRLCAQTMVGCSICTNSSRCKSCMAGYYLSSNSCKSCESAMQGCANCNTSSSCLICIGGYYKSGSTCTRCLFSQYGCHQCENSTYCLECDKNSYLSNGTCISCKTISQCIYCNSSSYCLQCRPGYYVNAGVCTGCWSNANPYCLICSNDTTCVNCVRGYRLNSSNLCQKCLPQCLFCNTTDHCFECISTMYVTSSFTCDFCLFPCLTCSGTSSYCLQCVPTYYLSAVGTCLNCPVGCLTCNTSTRCQSCDVGYYLDSTTRTCKICNTSVINCRQCTPTACIVCQLDYFLVSGACKQCSTVVPNCIICNNSTLCLQCMTGYYETGLTGSSSCSLCQVGCSRCNSSTQCYDCKQGYYLSSQDCVLCANNCLTCTSSTATSCTSCIQGYYLSTNTTGSCVNCSSAITNCSNCLDSASCLGCNIGYFLSSSTTCTVCTFPCTSCNSSVTDCLTCSLGYYRYLNGSTGACSQCTSPCSQCSTSATTCLNCIQGYYFDSLNSVCLNCQSAISGCAICDNSTFCILCSTGWFPVNGTCQTCTINITHCLKCNVLGSSCSLCEQGYTLSSTNTSCISCANSISNCEQCSSTTVCLSCQAMYYLSGANCSVCSIGCLTCYNSTVCEVCIDSYTLLADKTCQLCENSMIGCQLCSSNTTCTNCITGYYFNASQCYACRNTMEGCEYCSDSSHCTSCSVYYQLQTNSTCKICNSIYPGCQICANSTVGCVECEIGYFLNISGQCLLCDNVTSEGCLKCISNSTCTQCMSGYYLNSSNLCQKCETTFSNCIYCNSTACLECKSAYYLNLGVCSVCANEGCQICLQSDPTKCVGCNSRYYLSGTQCLLCSLSIPECLQCNNPTTCLHCTSGFHLNSTDKCALCSDNFPGCSICSPTGCSDCMSNFFLNSTDLRCHNCTDYIIGCAFCISQTFCLTCQNGYFAINNTCQHCSVIPGCLYCINQTTCKYCQESYYLSPTDNKCYSCINSITACYACSDSSTCISCLGQYKLIGGQCQQAKGEVMRSLTSIGIKSYYVNDTCLKHILFAREFTFTKVEQDWPSVSQFVLANKNYTRYTLVILKVQWGIDLTEIIFYTDNPIADQLSQSIKSMPFIKTTKKRFLADTSVDLDFNLKFMLTQDAAHDIMPNVDQVGDLYLGYPYSDSQFYQSYLQNRKYNLFIFGLLVTILIMVAYTAKLCFLLPSSKQRGSIIPHIFSIKCAALGVYPTYAQYINYCYGFMTADFPWLNGVLGQKFGNSNDVTPKPFGFYYVNLSLISTYAFAIIFILVLWMGTGVVGYAWDDKRRRTESYKSFLYNFFSLGAITCSCMSLQGAIFNPIETMSVNSVFYIIGIALYLGLILEIAYSWFSRRSKVLAKLKSTQDDIGTVGHFRKFRLLIKATLLSLMHISPLYFVSVVFCTELAAIAIQHYIAREQKPTPRIYFIQHLSVNLALLLLVLISDALIGTVLATILITISIFLEAYISFKQYREFSNFQQLQIPKQAIISSQFTQLDFNINAKIQKKNSALSSSQINKKQSLANILKEVSP